jgi:uncharacterized protein (TIGR04255 family)
MSVLELPDPDTSLLPRSPLRLVVCQVRHDRTFAAVDATRVIALHSELADRYPTITEAAVQTFGFLAGPGGAQMTTPEPSKGWQFRSADETWTVTIQPDFFSLETSAYLDWSDFRERLLRVVRAVGAHVGPVVEQRVGLRYVDEVRDPVVTDPVDWRGWIDESLLGPLVHPSFGPALRSTQQVLELEAHEALRVILRHGTLRVPGEKQWLYLLDHDCFRQQGRPFDADALAGTLDDLQRLALQVFQAAITPRLYRYLKGEDNGR